MKKVCSYQNRLYICISNKAKHNLKQKKMTTSNVTFKVEQNAKYGDFRVVKYLNGTWLNEIDGNWTKDEAEQKAEKHRELANKGMATMTDNV